MDQINVMIEQIRQIKIENIIDLLIAIGVVILFRMFSSLFSYAIVRMANRKEKNKTVLKKNSFYKPLKLFFTILGIYLGILILKLPADAIQIATKLFKISIIILVANGLANMVRTDSTIFDKLRGKLTNGDDTATNFIIKIIRTIIYSIAGFVIIKELGYDLSGLITGLGLGGVIIALASQDLAKNLFDGFSIILDKPFVIGDWIEIDKYQGTVIDISFRSTKIKTIDNTTVTLPNSTLVNTYIINWSRLEQRRYQQNLLLPLEISAEKIQQINHKLQFMLQNQDHIQKDTININFNEIKAEGINIFIYFYTDVVIYTEYLKFKEQINCAILDVIDSENIKLAYPSNTVYVKGK